MWSITGIDIMLLEMPLFLRSSSTVFLPLYYGRFRFRRSGKPYLRKRKRGLSIKMVHKVVQKNLECTHAHCMCSAQTFTGNGDKHQFKYAAHSYGR